jgi:energy-coupling factor transport system permease protein
LLRATPAFLFQAGVVISIAITFVPQMVISAREIRQAQRIRGHRFRGIRDLLPLVLPLLANGLERAIQLAETMEARGFGSSVELTTGRRAILTQSGTLLSLACLLAGLVVLAFAAQAGLWGWSLVLVGVAGLAAVFWLQGRRVRRSRYRQPTWRSRDTAVVCASAVVIAAVVAAKGSAPASIYYSPYPPNSMLPPFNPLLGAALLFLALPALLAVLATPGSAPAGRKNPQTPSQARPGEDHTLEYAA